jgi:tetratricopeptide (TPR) repeat protein
VTSAYRGRAEINVQEKRFAEAESDLRTVLKAYPDSFQAWERLAVCYERQGRLEDAAKALREGRAKVPAKQCTLTEMLSVVLYRAGRKDEAVSELESVRGKVRGEYDPSARMVLYRLGLLYEEAGKKDEAGSAFREYLELTRDLQDPMTLRTRAEVQKALTRLAGPVSR